MRINKFFTDSGFCSRREADRLIEAGRVGINGRPAKLGDRIQAADLVTLDGKKFGVQKKRPVVIAYNKPVGVECTTDQRDPDNIIDALNYPQRVFPIGRLDQMSEGLILLTNIGDIVNLILRSRYANEKEYLVEVDGPVADDDLRQLAAGIIIFDRRTLPCKIERVSSRLFKMTLTEGRNRQIRRMFESVDRKVTRLRRVRVMNVELGKLPSGKYRELTGDETEAMFRELGLAEIS